jgi:hypothetical protein
VSMNEKMPAGMRFRKEISKRTKISRGASREIWRLVQKSSSTVR